MEEQLYGCDGNRIELHKFYSSNGNKEKDEIEIEENKEEREEENEEEREKGKEEKKKEREEKEKRKTEEKKSSKEISATYFFLINLYEIGNRTEKLTVKETFPSLQNVKEGFKNILDGWSLTSPSHPTIRSYIKSKQFYTRIFYSLLLSAIVSTSSFFILYPPLADKFYSGFPFSILTTSIFVYSTSGSAVHLIKVRIGGFTLKFLSFIFP